jgi:hypothetical protein
MPFTGKDFLSDILLVLELANNLTIKLLYIRVRDWEMLLYNYDYVDGSFIFLFLLSVFAER